MYPSGYTGEEIKNGAWQEIVNDIEEAKKFDSFESAESYIYLNNWKRAYEQQKIITIEKIN